MKEIEELENKIENLELKKEIRTLKINLLFFVALFIICHFLSLIESDKQTKRLDAQKEVITLLNKKNDNLSTRMELLMENQMMIYKKVKKYERNRKNNN